jgi:hypothetical protein
MHLQLVKPITRFFRGSAAWISLRSSFVLVPILARSPTALVTASLNRRLNDQLVAMAEIGVLGGGILVSGSAVYPPRPALHKARTIRVKNVARAILRAPSCLRRRSAGRFVAGSRSAVRHTRCRIAPRRSLLNRGFP